ncbi:2-keto-4-pentenoate hydratase [Microbacterium sp. MYb62]|uniref:2-keto-4-pentenoate hydratase n=1 Tax=Microbacterium sp. MYb62 TaxID=1848690 RepID=UPI000CFD46CA|nr:fumarylacetoacetate hydrolase family protein [Microbacterium sp. MYb62]PRB18383.1 4-oxalocrotonate decarboxylase [Microbacterium sp. MYb62]
MTADAVFAAALDTAQRTATAINQFSSTEEVGLDTAYATQHALIARRLARGERLTGLKLGFTSQAKAQQMGVSDVTIGTLTDAMRLDDDAVFDRRSAIHPRIEPEVAYLLASDIDGTDIDGAGSGRPLAAVIAAVAPALEIIDSRYRDFRFSLADVVADNTSAAAYVVGPWTPFDRAGALDNRAVTLEVDGRISATGSTAAILGDPGRAVAAAARLAARHGFTLRAGSILLAGAATAAVPLPDDGTVEATIAGLGRVGIRTRSRADSLAQKGS